jgi:hypothetical protein
VRYSLIASVDDKHVEGIIADISVEIYASKRKEISELLAKIYLFERISAASTTYDVNINA